MARMFFATPCGHDAKHCCHCIAYLMLRRRSIQQDLFVSMLARLCVIDGTLIPCGSIDSIAVLNR